MDFIYIYIRFKARSHQWQYYKDSDKDIVVKIVLNIKNSRVHTTAITIKAQRNDIIGFTFISFQLMNDTNIDIQSESILLIRALEFKACTYNKQTISSAGVYANIVIFIVILRGVKGAFSLFPPKCLHIAPRNPGYKLLVWTHSLMQHLWEGR